MEARAAARGQTQGAARGGGRGGEGQGALVVLPAPRRPTLRRPALLPEQAGSAKNAGSRLDLPAGHRTDGGGETLHGAHHG